MCLDLGKESPMCVVLGKESGKNGNFQKKIAAGRSVPPPGFGPLSAANAGAAGTAVNESQKRICCS